MSKGDYLWHCTNLANVSTRIRRVALPPELDSVVFIPQR